MKCFSFGAQDLCLCSITYACSDMVAIHTCLTSSNRDAGNDLFNWLAIGTWILPAISSPLPLPQPQLMQQTFVGMLFAWVLNVLCQLSVSFLTLLRLVLFFAQGLYIPWSSELQPTVTGLGLCYFRLVLCHLVALLSKFWFFDFSPPLFFAQRFNVSVAVSLLPALFCSTFFVVILACKALGPSAGIIGGYLAVYPTLDNAVL